MSKGDAKGMRGYRTRNIDGKLREKRSDTLIRTIEKQYGIDLGVRGNMQLGTYLKKKRIKSLNDIMHRK
jgi:hypothetical protein